MFVKFVGDNVDKQINVRDIRSDHHGKLIHMLSIFAVKARVSPPALVSNFSRPVLCTDTVECFLPSSEDIALIRGDLEVLVSRVMCEYIKDLQELKRLVTKHIPHACTVKRWHQSQTSLFWMYCTTTRLLAVTWWRS